MEFVIATALTTLAVGVLVILSSGLGQTILSITSQMSHNQNAGNGVEFILSRIELANSASNDASGNVLTLSFDDDPDVDSNNDSLSWNDQDHFEQFIYRSSGTNWNSDADNFIYHRSNTNSAASNIIVPSSVRGLTGSKIFKVSNNVVFVNFRLLTTNQSAFSQNVEIRTRGIFRNKLK
jgi:hypothetical protein